MARLQVVPLPGEKFGIVIDRVESGEIKNALDETIRDLTPAHWNGVREHLRGKAVFTLVVPDDLDVEAGDD